MFQAPLPPEPKPKPELDPQILAEIQNLVQQIAEQKKQCDDYQAMLIKVDQDEEMLEQQAAALMDQIATKHKELDLQINALQELRWRACVNCGYLQDDLRKRIKNLPEDLKSALYQSDIMKRCDMTYIPHKDRFLEML